MSKEAVDLINRMIQLSPGNRLGATLETIAILKQHPFFAGIDFDEVSSAGYTGLKQMVLDRFKELNVHEDSDEEEETAGGTLHEK